MKIYSIIGYPIIIENTSPLFLPLPFLEIPIEGFYLKGELVRGFVLKKNHYFYSRDDIFKQYGTFENENGIGVLGKKKTYIQKSPNGRTVRVMASEPFFIGDILNNGEIVVSSVCEVDFDKNIWVNEIETARTLPLPLEPELFTNNYNQIINDTFQKIRDELDKLKDAFNTLNVGIPTQGWATPPNSTDWNTQITAIQTALDTQITSLTENIL